MLKIALISTVLLSTAPAMGMAADAPVAPDRWWPVQKAPRVVVRGVLAEPDRAEHMLLQSVAGLAAQAVNEGRGDEMVWIDESRRPDYARWHAGLVKRLGVGEEGPFSTLDLVRRYARRGIIKGYVLYKADAVTANLSKAERRKADS